MERYIIGENGKRRKSKAYNRWAGMLQRCYNPDSKKYKNYGERGILVCDRWLGAGGFENFYEDMGECPAGKSIDRKNNDLGYSPENCHWATQQQQIANRRDTRNPNSLRQKAILAGLPYHVVQLRIWKCGWDEKRALTTPKAFRSPRKPKTIYPTVEQRVV